MIYLKLGPYIVAKVSPFKNSSLEAIAIVYVSGGGVSRKGHDGINYAGKMPKFPYL